MSAVVRTTNEPAAERCSTEELIARVVTLSHGMRAHVVDTVDRMSGINRSIHLLSMNARIEAARVGHAGAGFAVVAEELTRLSSDMKQAAGSVVAESRARGADLDGVLQLLDRDLVATRLCDLAYNAIDIVDRNLYERSCDVRWWATEPAVTACLKNPAPASLRHASQRLGQILDSYTVYADLVIADAAGRILANGRPAQFRAAGMNVSGDAWFTAAMATRSGSEFGFQSMHDSPLVAGQSVLIYSCAVRESELPGARPLGVLGILFKWKALGQTVLEQIPLTSGEWADTRACIVDAAGCVLADTGQGSGSRTLDFAERAALFRERRGVAWTDVSGQRLLVCHAASPGFETYRTGWHALLLRSAAA